MNQGFQGQLWWKVCDQRVMAIGAQGSSGATREGEGSCLQHATSQLEGTILRGCNDCWCHAEVAAQASPPFAPACPSACPPTCLLLGLRAQQFAFFRVPPTLQPQPAELQNPLPVATRQYVALALHSAVHNTRWGGSRTRSMTPAGVQGEGLGLGLAPLCGIKGLAQFAVCFSVHAPACCRSCSAFVPVCAAGWGSCMPCQPGLQRLPFNPQSLPLLFRFPGGPNIYLYHAPPPVPAVASSTCRRWMWRRQRR